MRLRLLPRDGYSWTGYVWLGYLVTPIWFAIASRAAHPAVLWVTIAAAVIFVPLYFWGFWTERRKALLPIVAIATIGAGLVPFNVGAWVFFVYASSFAGRVGRPVLGVGVLLGLIATVGAEAFIVQLPPAAWGPAVPIIILIGGMGVAFTEIGRRQTRLRRAAEEEAQRLAVIAERERIGRDLHDLLGHTLSVITLKAELASKLALREPERSLTEIREVERISREALAEVRRAVLGYGGSTLADELRHARTALESAGATLDCDMAPVQLSFVEEQTLVFAIREAVTNTIRHARARRCEIRLTTTDAVVRVEFRDDGKGGSAADGMGLRGMRARLSDLGGRVTRDGTRGTVLTITLPLAATQAAAPVADPVVTS
jgi:two-component system sensor histidine kinase DesK